MKINRIFTQRPVNTAAKTALLAMAVMAAACSNDADEPKGPNAIPEGGIEIPVSISLCSDWNIDENSDSRYAPNAEDTWTTADDDVNDVNTVVIYTFRRRISNDPTAPNQSKFALDNPNHVKLTGGTPGDYTTENPDHQGPAGSHRHKVFQGQVTLMEGYEYKVLAIAYPSTTPNFSFTSDEVLSFAGHNLEDFELTVNASDTYLNRTGFKNDWNTYITPNVTETPQLFYGFCSVVDEDTDIIRFEAADFIAVSDLKSKGLTGILYRAVAKVELTIQDTRYVSAFPESALSRYKTSRLALLANNIYTKCGLGNYDMFLATDGSHVGPNTPFEANPQNFTIIAQEVKSNPDGDFDPVTLKAYVLSTKTKLGLRIQVASTKNEKNGLLKASNLVHVDTGTGILAPDVAENVFYFRRNHIYRLTLDHLYRAVHEEYYNDNGVGESNTNNLGN